MYQNNPQVFTCGSNPSLEPSPIISLAWLSKSPTFLLKKLPIGRGKAFFSGEKFKPPQPTIVENKTVTKKCDFAPFRNLRTQLSIDDLFIQAGQAITGWPSSKKPFGSPWLLFCTLGCFLEATKKLPEDKTHKCSELVQLGIIQPGQKGLPK